MRKDTDLPNEKMTLRVNPIEELNIQAKEIG
jgi:hypothetical protein